MKFSVSISAFSQGEFTSLSIFRTPLESLVSPQWFSSASTMP